jgi:hypothetical protein
MIVSGRRTLLGLPGNAALDQQRRQSANCGNERHDEERKPSVNHGPAPSW